MRKFSVKKALVAAGLALGFTASTIATASDSCNFYNELCKQGNMEACVYVFINCG